MAIIAEKGLSLKYKDLINKSAKERLKMAVRTVEDFPQPGISFKDITPILQDGQLFGLVINLLGERYKSKVDVVVSIDARGFLIGSALAYYLGVGTAIVRKKGKLPYECVEKSYTLEYGQNCIEMHKDAIKPGQKVLVVDDVLATGGTMAATLDLVEQLGGKIIEIACLIELGFLKGREKLPNRSIFTMLKY